MLTSGDVASIDFGVPIGREVGFLRPAIVVTAQRLLDRAPNVIQVVPLTKTIRSFESDVLVEASPENGLDLDSSAQCAQVSSVAARRAVTVRGNVGSVVLRQVRQGIGETLDIVF